jgi:hypothetical protein
VDGTTNNLKPAAPQTAKQTRGLTSHSCIGPELKFGLSLIKGFSQKSISPNSRRPILEYIFLTFYLKMFHDNIIYLLTDELTYHANSEGIECVLFIMGYYKAAI